MNTNFEPVMEALFAQLVAAAAVTFTANVTADAAALTEVSTTANLFPGLPVFGAGVAEGAVIATIEDSTVNLSEPVTQSGAGVSFTTGFLTTGRRVQYWENVKSQPALFLRRIGVHDEPSDPFTITTLECEAWIYCNAGQNPDLAPDSMLTSLEQMVRNSLLPGIGDDEGRFTLGGLVYWCRVQGHSPVAPGDDGPQAITRIPILITLP